MAIQRNPPKTYDFRASPGAVEGFSPEEEVFGGYDPVTGNAHIYNDGRTIHVAHGKLGEFAVFCPALTRVRDMLARTFFDASNDVEHPEPGEAIRLDPNYAELMKLYARHSSMPSRLRRVVSELFSDHSTSLSDGDLKMSQEDFDRLAEASFMEPEFRFTLEAEPPQFRLSM